MALVWNQDLSVGYGLIDDQHKELFTRYNALLQACKDGKGREEIEPMLDFLILYVREHFAEEERFMQLHDYPEQAEHKQQHRALTEKVQEVASELEERGATVAVITALNQTLCDWLLRHVKQVDTKLGKFLAAKAA